MSCTPCRSKRTLRHWVTVQQMKADAERDDNNEVDQTDADNWETYCRRRSEFKTRGGSERFASDMIQAGQTHRVYMRRDSTTKGITSQMRMSYDGRVFNILAAADEDEMRRWMVLDVVEAK